MHYRSDSNHGSTVTTLHTLNQLAMRPRQAALQRLESFLERIPHYERTRNYDRPGQQGVSRLSHWIRFRVLTEQECVGTVLKHHPFKTAEKYLQELLWRTYWKGWLEMRPQVWSRYRDDSISLEGQYHNDSLYQAAIQGKTNLSFFNEWVSELTSTGYLHNHTRMWFASVWIFTLKLPWQLGASLMYRHLLDGDPASNTLSWRWVAGLHTPGKHYVARPDNIETYSDGRWKPSASELVLNPQPLPMDAPVERTSLIPVSISPPPPGALILIHDDDLSVDLAPEFSQSSPTYCLLDRVNPAQSEKVHELVSSFRSEAAQRCGATVVASPLEISAVARSLHTQTVHTMLPRIGYERDTILELSRTLQEHGISLIWHRRAWDERFMPLARAGFFKFWQEAQRNLGP